jgi:hypothetical protein
MLAALRCAVMESIQLDRNLALVKFDFLPMVATRRLVFLFDGPLDVGFDDELDGVRAVRGDDSRCETKLPT